MAVGEALSVLSSIFSIAVSVKELMAARGTSATEALDHLSESAEFYETLADPSTRQSVLVLAQSVISPEMLDQLKNEAMQCQRKHIDDRKKARDNFTKKDNADIDAAQCMCSVLRDVKRYNRGRLPDDRQLHDFWISYRCKN